MKATKDQVLLKIEEFKSNKGLELMINLYSRWLDEKEFEDFNDYEKVMKENMTYLTFVKATKKPFGFIFRVEDTEVIFTLNSSKYAFKIR